MNPVKKKKMEKDRESCIIGISNIEIEVNCKQMRLDAT